MMRRYGLEKIDDVDVEVANLKRFKPSNKEERAPEPNREEKNQDGFYNHHAEIMAERKQ